MERQRSLGGRLIDFAGWEMPVQYRGSSTSTGPWESASGCSTCRTWARSGSVDPAPATGLGAALVSDPSRLAEGRAHYSMICAEDGGIIDDLIVYRVADERFMVVPNASNATAVVDALGSA